MKLFKMTMLSFLFAITACSDVTEMRQNTGEMKDTTREMNDKLSKMNEKVTTLNGQIENLNDEIVGLGGQVRDLNKNISVMSSNMFSLKDISSFTYYDLRAGNAVMGRNEFFKSLDSAKNLEGKVTMAADYMLSFEFQLWKGKLEDTLAKRDELFSEGIQEFFQSIKLYVEPKDISKMNISPTSMDNKRENVYALAAVLHMLNYDQQLRSQSSDWQPISMLGLIEQGLQQKGALAAGTTNVAAMPHYQQTVLDNEQAAIYLLQLRLNVLSALVLSRVSNIRSAGLLTKIKMRFFQWQPNLGEQNGSQLASTESFLNLARETRKFLVTIGVTPRLSANIKGVFEKMDLKPELIVSTSQNSKDLAQNHFVESLGKFQKEIGGIQ